MINPSFRKRNHHGRVGWFHALLWLSATSLCSAQLETSRVEADTNGILYHETYRPQFHYTAARGWLNDPNGLVFFQGEYHLFYQHDPSPLQSDGRNIHWGHAVSSDLVHWMELPIALAPVDGHWRWSGSAVIDWHNAAGLQKGDEPAMLAFHTLTGVGESLAYSNDRGRTWSDYPANPLIKSGGRDPRVFWDRTTQRWIMLFYDKRAGQDDYVFYGSADLKTWDALSECAGHYECPDLFPLALDGNADCQKWVLVDGSGEYEVGAFNGRSFTAQEPKRRGDWGKNYYATQTWTDIPPADGRRIQIAWMRKGIYAAMPFNQQMTFPCELSLRTFPEGVRLCKVPVRELASLQGKGARWHDVALAPGENPLAGINEDTVRIVAEIDPAEATEIGFDLRGQRVTFTVADRKVHGAGNAVECAPLKKTLKFDLLLDRTSLETFVDDGRVSFASCFVAPPENKNLSVFATGGTAKIVSMEVDPLASAWPAFADPKTP